MNILYLTPHLSTGGMPEFLRKRIESIENNKIDNIRIHVIEYNMYSDIYIVQRNIIKSYDISFNTIGHLNDKYTFIKNYLQDNNIDIIHIDNVIETFNGITSSIIELLYNKDRTWRIIETSHNNKDFNKIYFPDAFAFCSPYQKKLVNDTYEIIEYPIIDKTHIITDNPYTENTYNILTVGLWTPGKNHKHTLEIAREYLKIDPNVIFNFVGNMADNFKFYWEDIDVPSNCKIWGEQSDMNRFYKHCNLFLFNSTDECNPIVLKEAMSFNKHIMLRYLPQYDDNLGKCYRVYDEIEHNTNLLQVLTHINSNPTYDYDSEYLFYKKHIDLYNRVLNNKPVTKSLRYKITYDSGVKCEILGNDNYDYTIRFTNNETNEIVYETTIKSNCWASPNIKYYIEWKVEIFSNDESFDTVCEILSLENKTVCIKLESASLGDTLAWYPYVKLFKDKHKCNIILKTFKNFLFDNSDGIILKDATDITEQYTTYLIGCYSQDDPYNRNPIPWNKIPLGKVASDMLGLDYIEYKALLSKKLLNIPPMKLDSKYVVIATNSTSKMKLWNNPNGWKELSQYLISKGFKVINISSENNINIDGVINIDDTTIENTISYIRGSEFFIGLSSGLSWLSWTLDKKCFTITGFIDNISDFNSNNTKIQNKNVCNSCWNSYNFTKEWEWCPINKNTIDEYICSKAISSKMVIDALNLE